MNDAALALFDEFVNGDMASFEQLILDARAETELLDFKTVQRDTAPLGDDGLRHLSKSASAFANSAGGIVVWGVDCRSSGSDDPDVVQALKPIKSLGKLVAEIRNKAPELVAPGLSGMRHESVEIAPDEGFVISYFPRWDGEPQMAMAKGEHRYYFRVNARSLVMPHYALADRFGRRPQPKLDLTWGLANAQKGGEYLIRTHLVLGIRNTGLAVAHRAGITLMDKANKFSGVGSHFAFIQAKRVDGKPSEVKYAQTYTVISSELYIAPGHVADFAQTECKFDQPTDTFELPYQVFCDGFSGRGVLRVTAVEMLNAMA